MNCLVTVADPELGLADSSFLLFCFRGSRGGVGGGGGRVGGGDGGRVGGAGGGRVGGGGGGRVGGGGGGRVGGGGGGRVGGGGGRVGGGGGLVALVGGLVALVGALVPLVGGGGGWVGAGILGRKLSDTEVLIRKYNRRQKYLCHNAVINDDFILDSYLASSSILCVTPRRNLTISTWLLRGACRMSSMVQADVWSCDSNFCRGWRGARAVVGAGGRDWGSLLCSLTNPLSSFLCLWSSLAD